MKIIGSEDYYDYVANIYGVDGNVVLDRRDGYKINVVEHRDNDRRLFKGEQISVCFCGTEYFGVKKTNGKVYWGEEVLRLGKLIEPRRQYDGKLTVATVSIPYSTIMVRSQEKIQNAKFRYLPARTKQNDMLNCPILYWCDLYHLTSKYQRWDERDFTPHPYRLKDIGFARVVDPDTAFKTLYSWILNRIEDKEFDVLENKEKITAKGFDTKASFRHR